MYAKSTQHKTTADKTTHVGGGDDCVTVHRVNIKVLYKHNKSHFGVAVMSPLLFTVSKRPLKWLTCADEEAICLPLQRFQVAVPVSLRQRRRCCID